MQPKIEFKHDGLMLDACILINLNASGQMEAILRSIPPQVAVAAYVSEYEIRSFDLQPFIDKGLLMVVDIDLASDADTNRVANYANALGADGEAYTGAIAVSKNWAIGTDERRVLKYFEREMPHLQKITTHELVKHWADTTAPERETVRLALQQIAIIGKFVINAQHPCFEWTLRMTDKKSEVNTDL